MAKANARTIYVREEDWKRWDDLAYAARVSRSEFIRTAVEAFERGNPVTKAQQTRKKVAKSGA